MQVVYYSGIFPDKGLHHIICIPCFPTGCIGEIFQNRTSETLTYEKIIENDDYYKLGDYVGISGIEQTYEKYIRGKKGVNVFLVDVHNRIKGSYANGKLDRKAEVGSNIISTIDSDLQAYGEKLMMNKIGSIVAIEPSTGEILSLVSAPTYSPELLVGRTRTENYFNLMTDTLKPLF